ncbi:DUF92 domain-containing protein [Pedobacter mucosus]|uniref:DUF92 domain-containing protein n=1 Tax=Pedobacter mucosus TaxID=2895286 RepID=UPI001EE4AD94|nr:DUF92 domain-containing protein [Pedobacter mucosus]UKT64956.1 DUF92 domain-containing protein [Pedobacter mucosus]
MSNDLIFLPIIIFIGMIYAIFSKKLTVPGAFTGGLLTFVIFIGSGYTGIAMMTTFFILGSLATSWQQQLKQASVITKEHKIGRSAMQVLANAGISAIVALIIFFYPELRNLMLPVLAAAFASATADTLSSEMGMVYGRRFFNIITLKPDHCGLDGVVSMEGTLIGVAGSCIIAMVYGLGFGWEIDVIFIIIAGTAGNLMDSILGALVERKGMIENNLVNFLNTLTAALVMLLLGVLF